MKEGKITETQIDISLRRILRGRFVLGQLDKDESVPFSSIPLDVVENKEHVSCALTMAQKSIVLLKNNKILPLKKTLKKISVIGPNANNTEILLGFFNFNFYFLIFIFIFFFIFFLFLFFNFYFYFIYFKKIQKHILLN
jgi:beta-glucosidase